MRGRDRFGETLLTLAEGEFSGFARGTVETVNNATSPPTVTVDWDGAIVPAKCPKGLTVDVDDVVLMGRFGDQLLILQAY